ncbi:MAG: sodium-independent anion transporter [Gaiellaceae bacterium]
MALRVDTGEVRHCSFEHNALRPASRLARAAVGVRAVVLDVETVPSIDVTAVSMLVELADELRRDGIQLVLARDVGAVRDLVRVGAGETALAMYPTVRAAVDALQKGD